MEPGSYWSLEFERGDVLSQVELPVIIARVEAKLPAGSTFRDKDGHVRDKIRVCWWLKPDPQRTIVETVFPTGSELAGSAIHHHNNLGRL